MRDFKELALPSLDKDLATLVSDNRVGVELAMQLQMLRLMRGRPFKMELNGPGESTMGWTDGKTWFPSEPGTFTTGEGPVPPTK